MSHFQPRQDRRCAKVVVEAVRSRRGIATIEGDTCGERSVYEMSYETLLESAPIVI
jgi:hypothetical protein